MLNRREVFSVLSGIPLVGWIFSVGESSESKIEQAMLQPGEFIVLPQTPFLTVEGEKHTSKDGKVSVVSYNRIPLGLNFKIVDYTPDKVHETMYRNGKLTQSDSPIWSYYDKKEQVSNVQKFKTRPSAKAERDEEIEELEKRLIREEDRNSELWSEIQKLKMEIWESKHETL